MIGENTRATNTSGGARISTARSGTENEMFFGTISPNTTCRNDTMSSAMMNATTPTTSSDHPVIDNGTSSKW